MSQPIQAQTLQPQLLPLTGRHLIEASAGTGKTFNITRLYLRLLLERQLSVQQILVMTFTKAATEELKGRIAATLRTALAGWGKLGLEDEFFAHLETIIDADKAKQWLQAALLELDEAAIYTIHGFCNRVLSQQAFESGLPFEVTMEADTRPLQLQAVQDWLRQQQSSADEFELLAEQGWHIPDNFIREFGRQLTNNDTMINGFANAVTLDIKGLQAEFTSLQKSLLSELITHQSQILADLIDKEQHLVGQWQTLLDGIQGQPADYPKTLARAFATFNKYQSKAVPFKAVLQQLKQFTKAVKDLLEAQNNQRLGQCYDLVIKGIEHIRQRIQTAKQHQAVLDYDDLISRLNQRLSDAPQGSLSLQLQQQYPVALVDEFQDTDAAQYNIFDTLYPQSRDNALLLMIGDPKQAIYGFRGGDIFTYLKARTAANYHWKMDTNWRSVENMVTAYNRLFWGSPLTEPATDVFGYDIHYQVIDSTEHAEACQSPLNDPLRSQAMQYIWQSKDDVADPKTDGLQSSLAQSCANEAKRLLATASLGDRGVMAPDIAFLVRSGREAGFVKTALANVGLDAVFMSNRERLFDSQEAQELQQTLEGIWHCQRNSQLIRALSSALFGYSAKQLASFQLAEFEAEFEQARAQVLQYRQLWQQKGVMALLLSLLQKHYHPTPAEHERAVTNMLHLAEVLQQQSRHYKQPQQLLNWLAQQRNNKDNSDDYLLRLESDQALIRIVTQHGSKGLEYPIVFVPFASKYQDPAKSAGSFQQIYRYQNPADQNQVCQLGKTDDALKYVRAEGHAEAVRLLYVAVTRAAHRCYLGVTPFDNSESSALGKALAMQKGGNWRTQIEQLISTAASSSELMLAADISPESFNLAPKADTNQLAPAKLNRVIQSDWRLSSFSALTRQAHQVKLDQKEHSDEAQQVGVAISEHAVDALRFTLKKGAAAGNLLHDILEHVDFSDPQWQHAVKSPIQQYGLLTEAQQPELIDWLAECLNTPLPSMNPAHGDFCLAELGWQQTLRESEFYFPMEQVQGSALAACLQGHRKEDCSEAPMPVVLPTNEQLHGMMHGFIDLIFEYQGRYYVADYKSTHLGDDLANYSFERLRSNNQAHFYDLQYLIYSLALHRYLSARIADYDPEQHFGGVYYFYLRGMSRPTEAEKVELPRYTGVYHCQISSMLLAKLDRLFGLISEGCE